jgi:hypothetical protein
MSVASPVRFVEASPSKTGSVALLLARISPGLCEGEKKERKGIGVARE